MSSLINKVAIVTGASRGIGRGIALQLGQNGAKVYITGRTLKGKEGPSLESTAEEIKKRGGHCIPVEVDHENDRQVEALFKRVEQEQNGQLDILVNAAFKGGEMIFENSHLKFWEIPDVTRSWDDINNVGLRNNYFCTVYASRLMVPRKQGLIVNITSLGGMQYAFNASYGIGKAGVDRISADCGIELKKHHVTCLSLLLGGVKTEMSEELVRKKGDKAVLKLDPNNPFLNEIKLIDVINDAESVEFAGKVISKLATDPNLFSYTSKVVIAADYAQKHGITDIDGRTIPSHRQINSALKLVLPKTLKSVANLVPNFIKVPQVVMDVFTTKF
jgi:dehydrogenase/reductase SDR family member 1